MLIDETAGSGGDLLPWMFRKNNLGPLIGKATWGGLVGVPGFPVLMDGGFITAPNLAFWTRENGWGWKMKACRPISKSSKRQPTSSPDVIRSWKGRLR